MLKLISLALLLSIACLLPVQAQQGQIDYRVAALVAQARQATAQDDVHTASETWRAAQQLLEGELSVAAPVDPRYYYITRWLGRSLMAEDRSADAERGLKTACSRTALTSSLRNDDVRATVDVYVDALRKNGKPQEAQEMLTTWSEINTFSSAATPASSATASGLQSTPSAMSSSTSGASSTPSAFSAINGSPERKRAIDDLKRDLFAIPNAVPSVPDAAKVQ